MKKLIFIIIIAFLITLLFLIIKPIRTLKVMEIIAKEELMDEPFYLFNDKYFKLHNKYELNGPIIKDNNIFVSFIWYKILDWGDTAIINVNVYRYPFSASWRNYLFPSVSMNYQWYYFSFPKGTSRFEDLFPIKYKDKSISELKLCSNQDEKKYKNTLFLININRLFFFLKKGYFEILEKNENYSIVSFYEPIANLYKHYNNKIDTINTMSAKILFNNSFEIQIIPFDNLNENLKN